MLTIAQLSDSHIELDPQRAPFGGVIDTAQCFARAVDAIAALDPAPHACIHTGDLAERGDDARAYHYARRALQRLAARMPVFVLPGNHDDRETMRDAFADADWMPAAGPIRYACTLGELRLIALDTTLAGVTHGALDDEHLAWLDAQLRASSMPTLIAMHHPPFDTGIGFMDPLGLRAGSAALDALLRTHGHVVRVICGHVHRPVTSPFGGTIGTIAPGTAHQIPLDLTPHGVARFVLEAPGFALHRWDGRAMQTHVVPVEHGIDPHPYD